MVVIKSFSSTKECEVETSKMISFGYSVIGFSYDTVGQRYIVMFKGN